MGAQSSGDPTANWLWLVDLPEAGSALEVGGPDGPLVPALSRHFATVRRFDVTSTPSGGNALPFPDGSFDCVAVTGAPAGPVLPLLAACRRVLRSDGWVYLTVENALWAGHRRGKTPAVRPRVQGPASLRRVVARAGFRDVRTYYLNPPVIPRFAIPTNSRAVASYETHLNILTDRSPLRSLIARLGLHAFLYANIAALARR